MDTGAISNNNAWLNVYNLEAVYPSGALTATDTWYASYAEYGYSTPPYGAPTPGFVYAYAAATDTNVLISWTQAQGQVTNYIVLRGVFDTNTYNYNYAQIAVLGTNTMFTNDIGAINGDNAWNNVYVVKAIYPGGGLSQPVSSAVSTNPPPPTEFVATVDSTGTNVLLSWSPPLGVAVTGYIITRVVWDTNINDYTYSTIATVGSSTNSLQIPGAITSNDSYGDVYEVQAQYAGGGLSTFASSYLPSPPSGPVYNIRVAAQLVRGPDGRWQVEFSDIPPDVQSFQFTWAAFEYDADGDVGIYDTEIIPTSSITNGVYAISDSDMAWIDDFYVMGDVSTGHLYVQPVKADGVHGVNADIGLLDLDAPYFVDGRQHLKQNLLFKLRAATISLPCTVSGITYNPWYYDGYNKYIVPADTNYAESSFFHWAYQYKEFGTNDEPSFIKMSSLWPFDVNYQLHQRLYDPNNPNVPSSFVWTNDEATVPAPAVLGVGDPYWISQGLADLADVAAYTNAGNLYLLSGANNLYGLAFATAMVNEEISSSLQFTNDEWQWVQTYGTPITIATGGSTGMTNVNCFFSQTADPSLQTNGYYFGIVNTPGAALPGDISEDQNQPNPIPVNPGFAVTNKTGLMIASVGSSKVVGGWAKYSVSGTSPTRYAYLGQYFTTNTFLLDTSGTITTNSAGVASPYGEFFPKQPGLAVLFTMPDIDPPYQQGTCTVAVVSLNTDANHDGMMDFTYQGPDFVSASKPFRFWINDNQDSGDFGGNYGIPGASAPDGTTPIMVQNTGVSFLSFVSKWSVHGTRDLVDFFPVYINVASLFQSNAMSAGISMADTNWQFVLSQADGALRFAYTDLTPTNYMNFLQDTNESDLLSDASLTTISNINNGGAPLMNAFLNGVATNNQGIILVEAWKNTTQPLVLTIYHGTNQIAQTSLPLSISGVEQMFRSKTMMLNPHSGEVPDRLTDADVPNEPDTIDKNFVFLHGYNVLPDEARGVQADVFKRMYWAGSHAKFWGVTWEGADTKGSFPFGNRLTPNYHTNVVEAFATAPVLADFITTLTNSGPVVVAAHSLGNMVVLSAISDWNAPIDKYFMMDAAVPIEAIDPASSTNIMIPSAWLNYSNWTYASKWYQLFPTNDARSTLNWNNRLGNLHNADVYNFYSSGEEVLRTYTADAPVGGWAILTQQLSDAWPSGVPFGGYTWYWQEKGKGVCQEDWIIGSSHGGWLFPLNSDGYPTPLPPATANALSNATLQTNPVFTVGSYFDHVSPSHPDWALLGSGGSAYAAANRNRILADAIPAMSLVAGANPVPKFTATDHNLNMNTVQFQNGWSLGRTGGEAGKWHHSDFVQMAYTFTYKLFSQFVATGNLK